VSLAKANFATEKKNQNNLDVPKQRGIILFTDLASSCVDHHPVTMIYSY